MYTHPSFTEEEKRQKQNGAGVTSKFRVPRKHLLQHVRCLKSLVTSILIPFLTSTSHRFSLNGWMGLIESLIFFSYPIISKMAPMILQDFETGSRDFNFAENSTDFFIKMIKKLNRKKNSSFVIFEDTVTKEVSLEF